MKAFAITSMSFYFLSACHNQSASEAKGQEKQAPSFYKVERKDFLDEMVNIAAYSDDDFGCGRSGFKMDLPSKAQYLKPLNASLPEESVDESRTVRVYAFDDIVYTPDKKVVKRYAIFTGELLEKIPAESKKELNYDDDNVPAGYQKSTSDKTSEEVLKSGKEFMGEAHKLYENATVDVRFGSNLGQRHFKIIGEKISKPEERLILKDGDGYLLIGKLSERFMYSSERDYVSRVQIFGTSSSVDIKGNMVQTDGKTFNPFYTVAESRGNGGSASCVQIERYK